MKVLVTGGAGFVGSHTVDSLIDQGSEVVVVDDLSTGFEGNLNTRAKFYRMDICDPELDKIFDKERPQAVVHLAAHVLVAKSTLDPQFDAKVNVLGSLNVVSNCVRWAVEKIVYSSSCAVYGAPQYLPVNEVHQISPASPYGISKHTVEHYLELYRSLYGLSYVALRYGNVYGPRQNPKGEAGVVAIFIGKMHAGEQATIFGSGDKTRDYVFVRDVVNANLAALGSRVSGIYNVGTGIETSDQRIFDLVSRACGYDLSAQYLPVRPGEMQRISLDTNLIRKLLDWKPVVGLEEGIDRSVTDYRSEAAAKRKQRKGVDGNTSWT